MTYHLDIYRKVSSPLLQRIGTDDVNWRLQYLMVECQLGTAIRLPYSDISSSRPAKEPAPASLHSSTIPSHFMGNALDLVSIALLPTGCSDTSGERKLGRLF